ncbi:MAG: hypothetical protein ABF806_02480 [Bifidobacterium psychraerophilum]|uniref:hypothetical protein n=1 Tax=Bifidobacterium psychraerophilum TaxID=218140 RepID=UPI0039E7C6AD
MSFYHRTPPELLEKLKENDVAVVEYKVEPDAEEFKIIQAISLKSKASTVPEPVAAQFIQSEKPRSGGAFSIPAGVGCVF